MDDHTLFSNTRRLLTAMREPGQPASVALLLKNHFGEGAEEAIDRFESKARMFSEPIVFIFEMPGYVLVGQGDDVRPRRDPQLAGLYIANDVFMAGINAPAVLNASDFGMTPNAMRNARDRAAEWADTRCGPLAVAIRSISVSKDGRPTFEPAHPMKVTVF